MNEFEYYLVMAVRKKLRERLVGEVIVKIDDDVLYLAVNCNGTHYDQCIYGIARNILMNKISSESIAMDFIQGYNKYLHHKINDLYFK